MQTTSTHISIMVKGLTAFERRMLDGIIKLSQTRSPSLVVHDNATTAPDVVLLDDHDPASHEWAKHNESFLHNLCVVWVDPVDGKPPQHIQVHRPVLWTNLPALISKALFAKAEGDSARAAPAHAGAARAKTPQAAPTLAAQGRPTVLLVDDSMAVRYHVENFLKTVGMDVMAVADGAQAIEAIRRQRFACVLLDVLMPGMDGYETCRQLKALPNAAHTAVVMLTSKTSPFDRIRGKMAGCDAYLTKPVERDKLQQTIEKFIRK